MSAYKPIVLALLLIKCLTISGDTIPGQLSKDKCKKYAEYVPKSYECPFSNSDLTVGNSFAKEDEFPFTVILGYTNNNTIEWYCSATLISEDFILTAAHCLALPTGGQPVVARIGTTDLNSTEHLQEIKVKQVIIHPDYNRPQAYNDIGLVQLEKKVDFNVNARPACLFTEREIGADKVVNSGWGSTETLGEFDDRLQKVVLEVYDEQQCNKSYARTGKRRIDKGITYDTMVCAGSKSIVTLQTRTGGPLSIPHKSDDGINCIQDVVGIASFGKLGGVAPNVPDVYTRVSAFVPWIEQNVWK